MIKYASIQYIVLWWPGAKYLYIIDEVIMNGGMLTHSSFLYEPLNQEWPHINIIDIRATFHLNTIPRHCSFIYGVSFKNVCDCYIHYKYSTLYIQINFHKIVWPPVYLNRSYYIWLYSASMGTKCNYSRGPEIQSGSAVAYKINCCESRTFLEIFCQTYLS